MIIIMPPESEGSIVQIMAGIIMIHFTLITTGTLISHFIGV